jgi:hypothetical protein
MKGTATYLLGFASGWAARAIFDSWRGAVVSATAVYFAAVDSARRHAGFEREYFEDLVAEGRAKWEAERSRRGARSAHPSVQRDHIC